MYLKIAIRFLVLIALFLQTKSQEECKLSGCFPATGDLLVGREKRITASSTCGLSRRERYCIVSFLEKTDKCFYCESTRAVDRRHNGYLNSHLPKYMVTTSPKDRLKGWWQSENGVQEVTIKVDLEAEFVFTHLIMTFKTFRPKAMYIERSWNYGKDWSVYRYFAFDCKKSFPNIPRGPQKNIDDVICEERYSKIEPSTGGEVVMKVLDSTVSKKDQDPYSLKVQNLLKLTNLRVKMKELHTLGDDVLLDNPEVNRKYYYALYEMVVRGSCSCYGHAEQCIPSEGTPANSNMVHGKCNCTHFTTGVNCERCMDGYNDEPWRPAYQHQLNECKKCNCNGHTDKCHFDPAIYKATRNTSGGVCDDCQHNTAGRQCERCKPLYYRDPFKNIVDPDVCKPCDCDPSGSFGSGECETIRNSDDTKGTVAGRCICKSNVEGTRCDRCKDGFWNMLESNVDGCQSCNCDDRGTVSSKKCDQQTGSCRCKRYVTGLTCSKCSPGYWALGTTPEGCKPCNCDPGGAKNSTCDDISGMCQCRKYLTGRKCDKLRDGYYFQNLDRTIYEAEVTHKSSTGTKIIKKIHSESDEVQFTGDGYLQVGQGSVVRYDNVQVPNSGSYSIVFRYDSKDIVWNDVRITVSKASGEPFESDCGRMAGQTKQVLYTRLPGNKVASIVAESVCLKKGIRYNVEVDFRSSIAGPNEKLIKDSMVLLPDVNDLSIFTDPREGDVRKREYKRLECKKYYVTAGTAEKAPEQCKKYQFSISSILNNGALPCQCDPTGTQPTGNSEILTCTAAGGQCPCKPGVGGRRCDQCKSGHFGFGSNGCQACDCSLVGSTSEFCDLYSGKCDCRTQLEGRKCDSCPANHYGFPNCRLCRCSGHSNTCNAQTGECTNCRHNTAGFYCHKCAEGYYGDATKGTESDCQRCQCPGGSSGNQFSTSCRLQGDGKVICDNCLEGYTGNQCERCSDGYYGFPVQAGGSCKKCDCNGNIDRFAAGKCNPATGVCYNCINNAAGDNCEKCKVGFYGNAKNQTCKACSCDPIGTDLTKGECDNVSGKCPCLPNVAGMKCNKCAPGFFNLASGKGCEPCNCYSEGSLKPTCDQSSGKCQCRLGYGGRNCTECEDNSWGNPNLKDGCKACGCNLIGSKTLQCNRMTGECECNPNVVGIKCDMCAPRTSGEMPKCERCHTCNDQWEDIVNDLEKKVKNLMKLKGNSTFNATEFGLYAKEIESLNNQLRMIEAMMRNRLVDANTVNDLRRRSGNLRSEIINLTDEANRYIEIVDNTTQRDSNANEELNNLDRRFKELKQKVKDFKSNATKIIESDVGGALNSTRDSLRRSDEAQKSVDESREKLKESKKLRKNMKKKIIDGGGNRTFEELDGENNRLIDNLTLRFDVLEKELKWMNEKLCGGEKDKCGACTADSCATCGAAGGDCNGAKYRATNALAKAVSTKEFMLKKLGEAKILLKDIKMAEKVANDSKLAVEEAERLSKEAKVVGEEAMKNITELVQVIKDFLNKEFQHPNVSKELALKTLNLNISLTPEEVEGLAKQIKETVEGLENVDKILNESRSDYYTAIDLKRKAMDARDYAVRVMNKTDRILRMLKNATELQNTTGRMIGVARAVMKNVEEVLKQLKEKMNETEKELNVAAKDTDDLENKRNQTKTMFGENRRKLTDAEKASKTAQNLTKKMNETSEKLNERYGVSKDKLNEKINITGSVQERVENLSRGAIDLFKKTLLKIQHIEQLKATLKSNENRIRDLRNKLKRLEILAKFSRNKIRDLVDCHAICNPRENTICKETLSKLNEDEKKELENHEAAINSRST